MTIYGSVRIEAASRNDNQGLLGKAGMLWARLGVWLRTCADHYDAAAQYEQLSRLSDAELHRRGLRRDTLARDLCERCEGG